MAKVVKYKKIRRKKYKQMAKTLKKLAKDYEKMKEEFQQTKDENEKLREERMAFSKSLSQKSDEVILQKAKAFYEMKKQEIEAAATDGRKTYSCKLPEELHLDQTNTFISCLKILMPDVFISKNILGGILKFTWK